MDKQVIWERQVDEDTIAYRKQRFVTRFVALAIVIMILAVVLGASMIGTVVVLGVIGGLWGNMVRYQSLSDRANPTLSFDGVKLSLGEQRSVIVEDVKRYSTLPTTMQTSIVGKHSRISIGKVIFRMDEPGSRRDPQLKEFGWPNMDQAELDTIALALEPILGDRWVEPVDLLAEHEYDKRTKRRLE